MRANHCFCFSLQKRKASNADQSTCSSDLLADKRSGVTDENLSDSQRKIDERPLMPKSKGASADLSSTSKDTAVTAKKLPAGGLDAIGHSTRGSHRETELPVKEEKESRRTDSSATVVTRDTIAGSGSGAKATNEKTGNAAAASTESSKRDTKATDEPHESADDHSAWETVEAKGRGNRNRRACPGQPRSERSGMHNASQGSTSGTGTAGSKKNKKPAASRRRNASRKMAKEIISSVLDGVDAEVKRRRSQVAKSVGSRALPGRLSLAANGTIQGSAWQARPMTLRDIVVGKLQADADNAASMKVPATVRPLAVKAAGSGAGRSGMNDTNTVDKSNVPMPRIKPRSVWVADQSNQSTAPTVPETLSGISATTQSSGVTDGDNASMSCITGTEKVAERSTAIDYSSSGDMAVFASAQQHVKDEKKETSPVPPLQTLPWPGNTYSASSSVASSLEVPHGRHLHHHHRSVANENDVGYHLLDVCDRLSRDMDVFMGRRAVALGVRRQERGALLAALQDTASVSLFG